jgi:hypothetical protein
MNDVKYQIFISSTFEDLRDERRAVMEQILNHGHIPVGMELFQASDEDQWNYIKRRIDDSDYYVVIIAERYGSENSAGISYTELEYRYAVETKIPVVAFLLDSDARKTWPQGRVEFTKRDKVNSFRDLCRSRMVNFWRNSDDLALKVGLALSECFRDRPRVGWVRANTVASARALEEIAALSAEKRQLQEEISALRQSSTGVPSIMRKRFDILYRLRVDDILSYNRTDGFSTLSLLDIFQV